MEYNLKDFLVIRRQNLAKKMENNSAFIILSEELISRNADVEFPFRQDSNFFYLTGLNEEKSALCIFKNELGEVTESLFIQQKTHAEEIWTGKVNGKEKSLEISGIEEILNFDDLIATLPRLCKGQNTLYLDLSGSYQQIRNQIVEMLFTSNRRRVSENCNKIAKVDSLLRDLRVIKDSLEIELMKESSRINVLAHKEAYNVIREKIESGKQVYEYEFQAILEKVWREHNTTWAYYPIVASGKNGTILHYGSNNDIINPNKFLLVDAGCEFNYYASDITRTYHFKKPNKAEQAIYDLVLKANKECIEYLSKDEATYLGYHELSVKILTSGLIDLNLLAGSIEENIQNKAYTKFYMHGIGHWLGLDVHDLGDYVDKENNRVSKKIVEGHSLTVEPGLYFDAEDKTIPEEYRGIAVRIEDDIIKTKDGVLVLTEGLDK